MLTHLQHLQCCHQRLYSQIRSIESNPKNLQGTQLALQSRNQPNQRVSKWHLVQASIMNLLARLLCLLPTGLLLKLLPLLMFA